MKAIDAVKTMRQIRDELSRRYAENPDQQQKDLKHIHEKYPQKHKKT